MLLLFPDVSTYVRNESTDTHLLTTPEPEVFDEPVSHPHADPMPNPVTLPVNPVTLPVNPVTLPVNPVTLPVNPATVPVTPSRPPVNQTASGTNMQPGMQLPAVQTNSLHGTGSDPMYAAGVCNSISSYTQSHLAPTRKSGRSSIHPSTKRNSALDTKASGTSTAPNSSDNNPE